MTSVAIILKRMCKAMYKIIQLIANQDGELCYALTDNGKVLTRTSKNIGFGAKQYYFKELENNSEETIGNPAEILGVKFSHKGVLRAYQPQTWQAGVISLAKLCGYTATFNVIMDKVEVTDGNSIAEILFYYEQNKIKITVGQHSAIFRALTTENSIQILEKLNV